MRPNTRSELREAASRTLGRCEGQSRAGRQPMLLMRTQGSQSQSVAVRRENDCSKRAAEGSRFACTSTFGVSTP